MKGLIDILDDYQLDYSDLVRILYDINDLSSFNVNKVVDELDEIYDESEKIQILFRY